jgi:hypothetical protein
MKMMSRESNDLQRYVQESLADRQEKCDWIKRAQEKSPWINVTERDWLLYGHLSVEEWLQDREEPTEEDLYDYGNETYEDSELDRWEEEEWLEREEESWEDLQYAHEEIWEPPMKLEYGGCLYPRMDVLRVRVEGDSNG